MDFTESFGILSFASKVELGLEETKLRFFILEHGDKMKANAALENKPQIVFFLSSV